MRKRSVGITAAAAMIVVASAFWLGAEPLPVGRVQWEYTCITVSAGGTGDADSLGKQGWELVSAAQAPGSLVNLYFKRQK